jgi:hypothetical protein
LPARSPARRPKLSMTTFCGLFSAAARPATFRHWTGRR